MAPRSSPQLRLFRNDFASGNASVALRLKGTKSNRDAVGARVTIETDVGRVTRIVSAGSGFLSQHSKELVLGLGKSQRIVKATITWPSGTVQTLSNLPLNQRSWIEEGIDAIRSEPFKKASVPSTAPGNTLHASDAKAIDPGTWLYQPFPAPDFSLHGLDGQEYSLSAMSGKPVLVCFFASWAPPSLATIQDLSKRAPGTDRGRCNRAGRRRRSARRRGESEDVDAGRCSAGDDCR